MHHKQNTTHFVVKSIFRGLVMREQQQQRIHADIY